VTMFISQYLITKGDMVSVLSFFLFMALYIFCFLKSVAIGFQNSMKGSSPRVVGDASLDYQGHLDAVAPSTASGEEISKFGTPTNKHKFIDVSDEVEVALSPGPSRAQKVTRTYIILE